MFYIQISDAFAIQAFNSPVTQSQATNGIIFDAILEPPQQLSDTALRHTRSGPTRTCKNVHDVSDVITIIAVIKSILQQILRDLEDAEKNDMPQDCLTRTRHLFKDVSKRAGEIKTLLKEPEKPAANSRNAIRKLLSLGEFVSLQHNVIKDPSRVRPRQLTTSWAASVGLGSAKEQHENSKEQVKALMKLCEHALKSFDELQELFPATAYGVKVRESGARGGSRDEV